MGASHAASSTAQGSAAARASCSQTCAAVLRSGSVSIQQSAGATARGKVRPGSARESKAAPAAGRTEMRAAFGNHGMEARFRCWRRGRAAEWRFRAKHTTAEQDLGCGEERQKLAAESQTYAMPAEGSKIPQIVHHESMFIMNRTVQRCA